eukprot:TRINITY_DN64187_c0_g1_i1.p1 TRINITY_DN64187_c0_g1~~TRINITY_DN64187_c0_g1_i1.p1  ORF type:complete len:275 (-),score=49.02 TRINITY_DN64187_c0_g1_i1:42-866(-)
MADDCSVSSRSEASEGGPLLLKRDMKAELAAWKQARAELRKGPQKVGTPALGVTQRFQTPPRRLAADVENVKPHGQSKMAPGPMQRRWVSPPRPLAERSQNASAWSSAREVPEVRTSSPALRGQRRMIAVPASPGPATRGDEPLVAPLPASSAVLAPEVFEDDLQNLKESLIEDSLEAYQDCSEAKAPPNSPVPGAGSTALAAARQAIASIAEAQAAAFPGRMLAAALERLDEPLPLPDPSTPSACFEVPGSPCRAQAEGSIPPSPLSLEGTPR